MERTTRRATLSALLLAATALSGSAVAAADNAKALHQQHCQRCHDDTIYTRPEPLVLSYPALKQRVKICDGVAASHLPEAQLQSVIDYLNDNFYKFQRK